MQKKVCVVGWRLFCKDEPLWAKELHQLSTMTDSVMKDLSYSKLHFPPTLLQERRKEWVETITLNVYFLIGYLLTCCFFIDPQRPWGLLKCTRWKQWLMCPRPGRSWWGCLPSHRDAIVLVGDCASPSHTPAGASLSRVFMCWVQHSMDSRV